MPIQFLILPFILFSAIKTVLSDISNNTQKLYFYKPFTTLLIVLLCIFSFIQPNINHGYVFLVLIGLTFSLGGDIALMFKGDKPFIIGLISFLIAQMVYSIAFLSLTPFSGSDIFPSFLLLVIASAVYVFLYKGLGSMRIPVAVYSLIVMFMVSRAVAVMFQKHVDIIPSLLLVIGAGLFYISDMILALDKFRIRIPNNALYILSTYFSAQTLFAVSTYLIVF